ncbi:MAG TPA: benzoyl-CoA-dihydrodiol lyase, partial [Actinobacteria bacterium]|nr:benzoyl-CoA-dihydrodiol lyase [Actinomycetota bacterium]
MVEFRVDPESYRHWRIAVDGPVATLTMDVDEHGGLQDGYELKLNSYDLGVDIELYDAVQRLRFEHPEVRAVVMTSGKDKIFCAGANIRMLAAAAHSWKVNFCKFTNETRNGIEDATTHSGQTYIAALNGTASGGGYELALACGHIMLIDDRSSAVSLPELPLLGVLPGTGGLTRVVDKRHVRRDLADYFATKAEGVSGRKAVQWRLVDEAVARPAWAGTVAERAAELAARSARPSGVPGVTLTRLAKQRTGDAISYRHVSAKLDRAAGIAEITVRGPAADAPPDAAAIRAQGADFYLLAVSRELDDLILDLRTNEPALGTWVLRTACVEVAHWAGLARGPVPRVSINLSVRQVADPQLPWTVQAAMAQAGAAPNWITLELTESLLLQNTAAVLERLHALRALGVAIAIDDFGT